MCGVKEVGANEDRDGCVVMEVWGQRAGRGPLYWRRDIQSVSASWCGL